MDGIIKVLGSDEDMKPMTSLEFDENYKVGTYLKAEVTFCVKEAREKDDGGFCYHVTLDDIGPVKVTSTPKDEPKKKTTDEQDVESGLKSVESPEEDDSEEEGEY